MQYHNFQEFELLPTNQEEDLTLDDIDGGKVANNDPKKGLRTGGKSPSGTSFQRITITSNQNARSKGSPNQVERELAIDNINSVSSLSAQGQLKPNFQMSQNMSFNKLQPPFQPEFLISPLPLEKEQIKEMLDDTKKMERQMALAESNNMSSHRTLNDNADINQTPGLTFREVSHHTTELSLPGVKDSQLQKQSNLGNSKSTRRNDFNENEDTDKNLFKIKAYGSNLEKQNTENSVNSPSVPQSFRNNIEEARSPEFMQSNHQSDSKQQEPKNPLQPEYQPSVIPSALNSTTGFAYSNRHQVLNKNANDFESDGAVLDKINPIRNVKIDESGEQSVSFQQSSSFSFFKMSAMHSKRLKSQSGFNKNVVRDGKREMTNVYENVQKDKRSMVRNKSFDFDLAQKT